MSKSFKGIIKSFQKAFASKDEEEIKEAVPDKVSERIAIYGFTKEEYDKQRYDLLDDRALKLLMTKPLVSARVDYAADRYGAPRGEVYARAREIKKQYGISLSRFARDDLYGAGSVDEIENTIRRVEAGRQSRLSLLAEIMGKSEEEAESYVDEMHAEYGVSLSGILDNELFKKSDEEIRQFLTDSRRETEARKERIKKANNWTDFDLERSRCFCNNRYDISSLKTYDNLKCWAYPREVLDTFAVPRDSYELRDQYNTVQGTVTSDKTRFDVIFKDFLGRKFWVNRDTSIEEFVEFIDGQTKVFCKPINLLGGHGCYSYTLTDDPEKDYEYFINEPKLLIEEVPVQHHLINEIYDKSINTVRVAAVIKDGEFRPIYAWMKFGAKGSVVDGRVGGGCFAGVNLETGIIETPAIDYYNNRFENHVDTGKPITGFQIPYWKEVLDLAERALRHVEGLNFIGWDICVTESGPVLIEGNSHPALSDVQLLYNYEGHEGEGQRWRYIDLLDDPEKGRRV